MNNLIFISLALFANEIIMFCNYCYEIALSNIIDFMFKNLRIKI